MDVGYDFPAGGRSGIFPALTGVWLKEVESPFAALAASDDLAARLIEASGLLKIRVPDDLAVLGVGNDDMYCEVNHPFISSITMDTGRIGKVALDMLLRLLEFPRAKPASILFTPLGVVTRESSSIYAVEDKIVGASLKLIEANIAAGIGVKWLVRRLGVSRPTLERRFLKILGRSPSDEIHRAKKMLAKKLLSQSTISITEVARQAGYSSSRRFAVAFRKDMGMTPTEFRTNLLRFRVDTGNKAYFEKLLTKRADA